MIKVKSYHPFQYTYISSARVSREVVPDTSMKWVKTHMEPNPDRGRPYVRISLFGPRDGPKDSVYFTKEQAKELAHAILSMAEDVQNTE